MNMLLTHALIRLRAAASNPSAMGLLLFSSLVAVVFWPGLTDASGAGWPGGQLEGSRGVVVSVTIVILWLVMWPMIAISPIRGQVVKGRRSASFGTQAHPALPISPTARLIAEALTVLAVVMIIRAPVLLFDLFGEAQQIFLRGGEHAAPWRRGFVEQSLAGAFIMLPFLLAGAKAAVSIEAYWLRSALLATALFGAMKLGWLETLPLCIVVGGALAALVLLLPNREKKRLTLPGVFIRTLPMARPFRAPESQFRRDLWLRPLPVAAALLGAEVGFIILDRTVGLPELVFYFASVLIFSWLLAFVPLQPMRSKMAMAGIFCKPGFQPGDFAAACGVLPMRRRVMTRGVFAFGLLTTAGVWLLAVGVVVLSAWFETGIVGLVDTDGDPLGQLLIPSIALIPGVAALLTCAIVGDRRGAFISGGLVLLLPQIGLLLLIFKASGLIVAALAVTFTVIASIPAVKHLRAEGVG